MNDAIAHPYDVLISMEDNGFVRRECINGDGDVNNNKDNDDAL